MLYRPKTVVVVSPHLLFSNVPLQQNHSLQSVAMWENVFDH